MWPSFQVVVPGKWVLAGEHAVLRGATAVALPHPHFGLTLTFQPQVWEGLSVLPRDADAVIHEVLGSVQDQWESEGRVFPRPVGSLQISSTIPIGAGLGSSAALCVALTRWMSDPLGIPQADLCAFATRLEHRFHGRSSGMDVAVIAAAEPVSFTMEKGACALGVKRIPKFTFHDTGIRSRTSDCVMKVEAFRSKEPASAMKIDESMSAASRLAMEGLVRFDSGDHENGLREIARAMKQADECFQVWGLVPESVAAMRKDLLAQGALAVKLTGAGGGGMLVVLWP